MAEKLRLLAVFAHPDDEALGAGGLWAITTRIAAADQWRTVWQAALCHQTQTLDLAPLLADLPEGTHRRLWGDQALYRVFSLVNHGRARATDLFAGLR